MQTTSTEVLKSYVFNEPITVDADHLQPLGPAAIFMVKSSFGGTFFLLIFYMCGLIDFLNLHVCIRLKECL